MPPRAFSYGRISRQKRSSISIARQGASADDLCVEYGWNLDDTLVFTDRNRSGFHGANRAPTAALTRCLKAIEDGDIPRGSVLIIENLDRLSRQDVKKAYRLFLDILEAGVSIATCVPKRVYRPDDEDLFDVLEPIWQMFLAHQESLKKSERLTKQWEHSRRVAREGKERTMQRLPHWLAVVDGEYALVPERVAVVRRIIEQLAEGVGPAVLAGRLNAEGVPTAHGRGLWRSTTLRRLVSSETLTGGYQPTRLEGGRYVPDGALVVGFYPPAVDGAVLQSARDRLTLRTTKGGRKPASGRTNVLRGLARVAGTETTLALQQVSDAYGVRRYLFVANTSGALRVHYDDVLTAILETVRQLRPADVLPPDTARSEREQRMAALAKRVELLAARQRDIEADLADPEKDYVRASGAAAVVARELKEATAERDALALETRSGRAAALGQAQTLAMLRMAAEGDALNDIDARIGDVLPLVVRRVEVSAERVSRTRQIVRLTIHLHNGEARHVRIDP
jgi:DNA invertase Pin-like site-specific DNA recombinase